MAEERTPRATQVIERVRNYAARLAHTWEAGAAIAAGEITEAEIVSLFAAHLSGELVEASRGGA